jgi:hypothetical protein
LANISHLAPISDSGQKVSPRDPTDTWDGGKKEDGKRSGVCADILTFYAAFAAVGNRDCGRPPRSEASMPFVT